ncbi:MAG: cupin domain-containing protein [Candidatus Omnitrophota bacterium]|jgi:quercetin dioxygenase-like cupin family protein
MAPSTKQHIKELRGRSLKLLALLDYQDDAVVSREIIKKDTGTVTLFAFDKGQGLSEHTAPFDALAYILDGEAKIFISGKSHLVKKSEMIIMPANKPHSLKALKKFKMLLVMVKG